MAKSSYELKETNSEVIYLDKIISLRDIITQNLDSEKYYIVAYLDYEVKIGFCEKSNKYNFIFNEQSNFEDQYIQKIRIFNQEQELYIWKTNNILKGRFRKDNQGNNKIEYIDANQILFGTKSKNLDNGFIKLSEEKRRIKLTIPNKNFKVNDEKKRVSIQTRNYIDYNEICQANYIDVRFVDFVQL
jgi:CRISPR-associated protein (TIGR03984 family)